MPAPITIHNQTGNEAISAEDRPVFDKAVSIAMRQANGETVASVDVYANARGVYSSIPEWLEYAVVVKYREGSCAPIRGPKVIGVIQRQPGADVESHS